MVSQNYVRHNIKCYRLNKGMISVLILETKSTFLNYKHLIKYVTSTKYYNLKHYLKISQKYNKAIIKICAMLLVQFNTINKYRKLKG